MKNKLDGIQKKMLKELNSMVKFYGADTRRRAVFGSEGLCQYHSSRGKCCSVGRRLNKKDHQYIDDTDSNVGTPISEIYSNLTTKIIKDLPCEFWEDMQDFHDRNEFWNKRKGISKDGLKYYEEIKNKILNNEY